MMARASEECVADSDLAEDEYQQLMEQIEAESMASGRYIVDQLTAMSRSRERWKKYRLLEYVCRGCGHPLLEVMGTDPWPVMLYSQIDVEQGTGRRDRGEYAPPIRRDPKRRFGKVEWPLPEEHVTRSHIAILVWCGCQHVSIDGARLYEDLRSGRRRRVISRDTHRD
jgi:hypothetical protein